MGTSIGGLLTADTISMSNLSGRVIAIDALNSLYAFLAIIRLPDGTPLTDRQGRVTSHLSGLFNRNMRLLSHDVHPVYVFDGESPELKSEEIRRRHDVRQAAHDAWVAARADGRTGDALKAAKESSMISTEMITESKALLEVMGIPVIQAPSEGEATAAQLTREGVVWAAASQDNDLLLYNCPRMIRNLVGRRIPQSRADMTIPLELIDLQKNLDLLGIDLRQLLDIAILIGTDYNEKVPNVGPKTALKLVQEYGNLERLEQEKKVTLDMPYQEIREIFLDSPRTELKPLEFSDIDSERILHLLCDQHDFDRGRIDSSLKKYTDLKKSLQETTKQSSLSDFF